MRFLHIMPSADPHGGGPIEGVKQRGLQLQKMGHSVEVVTLDDPSSPGVQNHPLKVHALGPTGGRYGYNPRLVPWLMANARGYDLLVINGMWQYHAFGAWRALRRLKVPYVVFTHGMLDPWFKHTYPLKHLKKWLYWPWADYRVLRDAAAVLFTTEEERLLARQSFWLYKAREKVVAYGTRTPPANRTELAAMFLEKHPQLRGKRLLLFLSRIQEKKGCDLLVAAFAQLASHYPDVDLVMAGPDQTGWMATLKQQAEQLGVAARIHWPGMLQGDAKWGAFYASEAFVLPSHQENFGIAVAEALGCGLPVLISNKVNIWREVQGAAAGLVAEDDLAGTVQNLQAWLCMPTNQRQHMAVQAQKLFAEHFTVEAMANSLLTLPAEAYAIQP